MHPVATVQAALDAGQLDFGENYAQQLRDKFEVLGPSPRWHFIGNLQRNKVKVVAGRTWLFHGFDRLSLAKAFGARSPVPQRVLIQVNTGGEESKAGVAPEAALALCEQVANHPATTLCGLMTIPPFREDPQDVAPFFRILAELQAEGRRRGLALDELSMGMSHDFEVAVAHGATLVRVGTAIFGPRPVRARAPNR
jgi:pyridoxal phosphate enzyme (YggS family)